MITWAIVRSIAWPILLLLVAATSSPAKDSTKSADKKRDRATPIWNVNYKSGDDYAGIMLQNVRTRKLGSRAFVVGEFIFHADDENSEYNGVEAWIPSDAIYEIMVFDDFESAYRIATKRGWPSPPSDSQTEMPRSDPESKKPKE